MCGIAGYFSRSDSNIAEQVMLSLYSEQHRGQESCGIAVADGTVVQLHKSMGYVNEVFTPKVLQGLPGHIAIGQVRYPTRGSSEIKNAQPYLIETLGGPIYGVASNGDIVNYDGRRCKIVKGFNDDWYVLNSGGVLLELDPNLINNVITENNVL